MSAPPPEYPDYPYSGYQPTDYRPPVYPPQASRRTATHRRATRRRVTVQPPGYPPPPGYRPARLPPAARFGGPPPRVRGPWAPGIIPLRPLGLSDIFNAAVVYIRLNPKATLGFTAIVIVITQPSRYRRRSALAAYGEVADAQAGRAHQRRRGTMPSAGSAGLSALAGVVLGGMLTVIVGRAVFGAPITIGQAWERIRGRLWALLGLMVLEALGPSRSSVWVGVIIGATSPRESSPRRFSLGFPIVLASIAAFVYL